MNKLLSIIVPIYNVESYLEECLDSLINQDLKKIKIILVNDGSTDNSYNIAKKYADSNENIILLNKSNGGLSDARNYGLSYADTKYISFIDSDDYAEKNYYAEIIRILENNDVDLIVSDIRYFWDNSDKSFILNGLSDKTNDFHKSLIMSPLFAWNKVYRKDIFDHLNIKYPNNMWYEDIPVSLKYFNNIDKTYYYSNVGINYRQRNTSILGSTNDQRVYHIFEIMDIVLNEYKETNSFNKYKDELEYLFIEQIIWYGGFRFLKNDSYKDLIKKASIYMKKNFPNYRKNRYLKNVSLKNRFFIYTISPLTSPIWRMMIK